MQVGFPRVITPLIAAVPAPRYDRDHAKGAPDVRGEPESPRVLVRGAIEEPVISFSSTTLHASMEGFPLFRAGSRVCVLHEKIRCPSVQATGRGCSLKVLRAARRPLYLPRNRRPENRWFHHSAPSGSPAMESQKPSVELNCDPIGNGASGRWRSTRPIDLTPVADLHNDHGQHVILDLIDDPVDAEADPVPLLC